MSKDPTTGRFLAKDLTGYKTGKLTLVENTGEKNSDGYFLWKALCECGGSIIRGSGRFLDKKHPIQCNVAKLDHSFAKFKSWVEKVYLCLQKK